MKGYVQWWNDSRGYGYIRTEETGDYNIFVHYSAIIGDGFKVLSPGQVVNFTLTDGPKGLQATNLHKTNEFVELEDDAKENHDT